MVIALVFILWHETSLWSKYLHNTTEITNQTREIHDVVYIEQLTSFVFLFEVILPRILLKEWNLNTLSQVQYIVRVNKLWIVSKHVSQLSDEKMLEICSCANYNNAIQKIYVQDGIHE